MPRSRNIKPGFFKNEDLLELPFEARLLFIGLWTLADREGRLEDRPKRIKIELFPGDNLEIDDMLNQLSEAEFIVRYEKDGGKYISITNFTKHQSPHHLEKASQIPAPGEYQTSTRQTPGNTDTNRSDSLIPDSLNLIPDTLNPETRSAVSYPHDFDEFWNAYPKQRRTERKAAYRAWKARINAGANPEQLITAARNYAQEAQGKEPRYVKLAKTFLGPDTPYEDYLVPRASPGYTHEHGSEDLREAIARKTVTFGGEDPDEE